MKALVLDSEAISQFARTPNDATRGREALGRLVGALQCGADVLVPAAVLAEQYRGGRHNQAIDACIARHPGLEVIDTTRELAKHIGGLLARAGRGSADHVDASVVATAVQHGGGLILTGDPDDIERLAAGINNIVVRAI
ncbi:MAG: type II toxin-antitoxin system VapC family toxin [Promicromonosporaceae bacterium]|nr:type II toxin-antitoxin system VapC family toxin [Promicromonosporaceae bacterium]